MPTDTPDDFRREYLLRLPLPLAQLYSRAHNAKDSHSRHDNCYYLFESLIKLAACPLIGSYADGLKRGMPHAGPVDRTLAHLALPSLGQWVAILRELARYFGNSPEHEGHPLAALWRRLNRKHRLAESPGIVALYRRIKDGPDGKPAADASCTLLDLFDRIVRYRNDVVGHGGPRPEAFFDHEMGPLMFPAVNEILAEGTLDPLGPAGTRLVYLTEMRVVEGGRFEVAMRELVGLQGERSAPMLLDAGVADTLAPGHGAFPGLALIWPGLAAPLRLDPLMRFRESEVADEVLLLNRGRGDRQVEYLSYTTGRTERDAEMAGALAQLLSQVTAHPATEPQPSGSAAQGRPEPESVSSAPRLGDYELLAELGRGGMGVVYLARQASLGRVVALKTLASDLSGNERALARFRREMRVLGGCDHPNIVKLLDSGVLADGQMYYTMEYVPGANLEQVWQTLNQQTADAGVAELNSGALAQALSAASQAERRDVLTRYERRADPFGPDADTVRPGLPPLPLPALPVGQGVAGDREAYVRRVVAMIRDAALALHTVHQQGVVHRDVGPGNLMLTPDSQRIVLMDFGLAKGGGESQGLSVGTGFMGKLRYAAPEQLASAVLEVGPPADVRGLGVTLWELVTRRRLFDQADDERTLAALIHEKDVPRLREIDPGFDRDLEAIVARATQREVPKRIQSAKRLADYLQMYLDGESLPIRPPTSAEWAARWVRRNKALVGSFVLGWAVIGLILVAAFSKVNQEARDANLARDQAEQATSQAQASLDRTRAALAGVLETLTESDVFHKTGLYGPQRELLVQIVGQYEGVLEDHRGDVGLQLDLARALRLLAETSLQIGQAQEAEGYALKALALLDGLSPAPPVPPAPVDDVSQTFERALLLTVTAKIQLGLGADRYADGIASADEAVDLLLPLDGRTDNEDRYARAKMAAYESRGDLSFANAMYAEALGWYQSGAAVRWHFYERDEPHRRIPADELAQLQLQIARAMESDGDLRQARHIYGSVIEVLEPFQATSPDIHQRMTPPMRLKLLVAQRSYTRLAQPEDRVERLRASLQMARQLVAESPDVSSYQIELARTLLAFARPGPGDATPTPAEETLRVGEQRSAFRELMDEVLPRLQESLPGNPEIAVLEAEAQKAWTAFQSQEPGV